MTVLPHKPLQRTNVVTFYEPTFSTFPAKYQTDLLENRTIVIIQTYVPVFLLLLLLLLFVLFLFSIWKAICHGFPFFIFMHLPRNLVNILIFPVDEAKAKCVGVGIATAWTLDRVVGHSFVQRVFHRNSYSTETSFQSYSISGGQIPTNIYTWQ